MKLVNWVFKFQISGCNFQYVSDDVRQYLNYSFTYFKFQGLHFNEKILTRLETSFNKTPVKYNIFLHNAFTFCIRLRIYLFYFTSYSVICKPLSLRIYFIVSYIYNIVKDMLFSLFSTSISHWRCLSRCLRCLMELKWNLANAFPDSHNWLQVANVYVAERKA